MEKGGGGGGGGGGKRNGRANVNQTVQVSLHGMVNTYTASKTVMAGITNE